MSIAHGLIVGYVKETKLKSFQRFQFESLSKHFVSFPNFYLRGMTEKILIIDFGSQYTQLIARRVRESEVYCEIVPFNKIPEITPEVKGIILSGSPASIRDLEAPKVDVEKLVKAVPVLGVCYGAQLMAHTFGGLVEKSNMREYGRAHLQIKDASDQLLKGVENNCQVWMSHADTIKSVGD